MDCSLPRTPGIASGHSSVSGRLLLLLLLAAAILCCQASATYTDKISGRLFFPLPCLLVCWTSDSIRQSLRTHSNIVQKVAVALQDIGVGPSLLVAFLAGCGNVLLTNPIWCVATRMQVTMVLLQYFVAVAA